MIMYREITLEVTVVIPFQGDPWSEGTRSDSAPNPTEVKDKLSRAVANLYTQGCRSTVTGITDYNFNPALLG